MLTQGKITPFFLFIHTTIYLSHIFTYFLIPHFSKRDTMHALVNDAKCVASSAGPFYLYGSNVVEFCAKYGTHYVDITGEVDWVKTMIVSSTEERDTFDGF